MLRPSLEQKYMDGRYSRISSMPQAEAKLQEQGVLGGRKTPERNGLSATQGEQFTAANESPLQNARV